MGLRARCVSVFCWLALSGACGGRVQEAAPLPSVDAAAGASSRVTPSFGGSPDALGSAGAQNVAGMQNVAGTSAGDAGAPSAGAPSLVALGCPDPAGSVAACPEVQADLDFRNTSGNISSSWVEPLQIPQFGTSPAGYYSSAQPVDPALWDRSALPAGACVFRLHGVPGSCLREGNIFLGPCLFDGGPRVSPGDFYENNRCGQGIAPGCPTSDPGSYDGFWWYMVPRGPDIDVVICAPECAQELQPSAQACLTL
jgi:hypothetical protein